MLTKAKRPLSYSDDPPVHVHVNDREIVKVEGKKESERLKLSTINYAQQTCQCVYIQCIRIVCVLLEGICVYIYSKALLYTSHMWHSAAVHYSVGTA